MNAVKQMIRKPIKTAVSIVLVALAVAILCLSVGQALAVRTTTEKLNRQFSTIAIPQSEKTVTNHTIALSVSVKAELLEWLEQTALEKPDVVKQISYHGILSAYIPQLKPLNITKEKYITDTLFSNGMGYYYYEAEPYEMPYSCAMLVITLEEISEPEEQISRYNYEDDRLSREDFDTNEDYLDYLQSLESVKETTGYTVKLTGTVTEVISLQEGYRDPVGRTARLTLTAPTMEYINNLELIPGEQYVVYGMDYMDEYWKLIGELNLNGSYDWVEFEPFDPSKLQLMDETERKKYQYYYEVYGEEAFQDAYARFFGRIIDSREYAMINAISMTLDMPISRIEYKQIRNEEGVLQELIPSTEVTYTDGSGRTVVLTNEEYHSRYQIPNIARLKGTVDDFLNASENDLWKKALERDAVNNQAFAVIGVDNMNYLADFSLGKVKIIEGRDFTAEELNEGKKVCIIHEELAQANGIEIGDTITASFYQTDQGLPYQSIRKGSKGLLNPTASFYFDTTPFAETAEYTVIGICRGERTFPDVEENVYGFSANTVYVPKSSVQTAMEVCNSVAFVTTVVCNGMLEEFHKLATMAGYGNAFRYNDQGYGEIAGNFHNYEELAKQIATAGIILYTAIIFMVVLLHTAAQRKNVRIMKALGAGKGKRFCHVFSVNAVIILTASLLGCLIHTLLWDYAAQILQRTAESAVVLDIESWSAVFIAAGQLLFAFVLNTIVSLVVVDQKHFFKGGRNLVGVCFKTR